MGFILFFGVYVWLILNWLKLRSNQHAARLGLTWRLLTVASEFLFGHLVVGNSWEALLGDYNLMAGRVWVLVLIWIAVAPIVLHRIQGRRSPSAA